MLSPLNVISIESRPTSKCSTFDRYHRVGNAAAYDCITPGGKPKVPDILTHPLYLSFFTLLPQLARDLHVPQVERRVLQGVGQAPGHGELAHVAG